MTTGEKVARRKLSMLELAQDLGNVSKACRVMGYSRQQFYEIRRNFQLYGAEGLIDRLPGPKGPHPNRGFWKCHTRLRLDGKPWNHKRVLRIYREMRLNLPRRTKKRVPVRERQTLEVPEAVNAVWSLDFMSDALYHGRRFRTLNILDEGVREALDIVIDTSIPSGRLVRTLEQLSRWRGVPQAIRCDNGPEFLSQAFVDWCEENQVEIRYIQPGKPNQNAYIERFNRTYREEVLNAHLFTSLNQVRELSYRWLETYNETRPHDALGRVPPSVFRRGLEEAEAA